MTEKQMKKLLHYIQNNYSGQTVQEAMGKIESLYQKQPFTEEEWDKLTIALCEKIDYKLLAMVTEKYNLDFTKKYTKLLHSFRKYFLHLDVHQKLGCLSDVIAERIPEKKKADFYGKLLLYSAERNIFYLVWHVLNKGADINYKTRNGKTALDYAMEYTNSAVGEGDCTLYRYLEQYKETGILEETERYYDTDGRCKKIFTLDEGTDNIFEKQYKKNIISQIIRDYGCPHLLDKETSSEELWRFVQEEYNWDDGLEVPYAIMMHENCCLGIALNLFYLAEGDRMFDEDSWETCNTSNEEWKFFVQQLYERIVNGTYKRGKVGFTFQGIGISPKSLQEKNIPSIFLEEFA